jgi:ketosteroid isomerase-like protein
MTVAERLRAAFEHGDFEEMIDVLDPNVVWRGSGADPPECRNRAEVRATFEWHISEGRRASPRIIAEGPEFILVELRAIPPVDGEGLHQVLTVADDRVVHIQDHPSRRSAMEAVGLE